MKAGKNQNTVRFIILTAGICLVTVFAWKFFSGHTELKIQEAPASETQLYGGNDWVQWVDAPEGVNARSVHPIVLADQLLSVRFVKPGDILLKIDYVSVYRAEMVNELIHRSAPGRVFIYTVKREGANAPLNLLIKNGFYPQLSFFNQPGLWSLFPWLCALGGILSLVALMILFPVIRPELKENWPLAGVLLCGVLFFSVLLFRFISLVLATDLELSFFEKASTYSSLILLSFIAPLYLASKLKGNFKWLALIPFLAFAAVLFFLQAQIFSGQLWLYSDISIQTILACFLVTVLTGMMLSLTEEISSMGRTDLFFHLSGIIFLGALTVLIGLNHFLPRSHEMLRFLSLSAVIIPVLNAASSQLKFGKVSLVLGRSLQFAFFAVFSLVLYFLIHQTLDYFGFAFRYQPFLEVSLLIILILLFRVLYAANEPRLRKYFVFALEKRKEQYQQFIGSIPQYSSSRQLCEDIMQHSKDYFGTNQVHIWQTGEAGIAENTVFESAVLERIYLALKDSEEPWSRSQQLPSTEIDFGLESILKQENIHLVLPLRVKENYYGLILLGAKRRGVYNLDDLEQLSRLVQQTRLTLGVLHLLEQERMLIEKNFEANLTALRSQINPHFLFNTLNTISALIHDAPDEAEKATEKLAFIFRYTLKNSDRNLVTVKDEISLVRTYLEIEQLRFGARLEVKLNIDESLENIEIPAFVIQTVVENCIKHGIARIIGKGWVKISISNEEGAALIQVEDNGPGIDLNKVTSSTGLNNILSRLERVYERKNLLNFENTGGGTLVTIKIPREKLVNSKS